MKLTPSFFCCLNPRMKTNAKSAELRLSSPKRGVRARAARNELSSRSSRGKEPNMRSGIRRLRNLNLWRIRHFETLNYFGNIVFGNKYSRLCLGDSVQASKSDSVELYAETVFSFEDVINAVLLDIC